MKRITAVMVIGALGLSGCSSAPTQAAAPTQPALPALPTELVQQQLAWGECENPDLKADKVECTTVAVPMTYADPGGKRISVAISRMKASDPARRRGVLLTNPGGPGGEGLSLAEALDKQPAQAFYDVIGMDPRGVGKSTTLMCDAHPAVDISSRPSEDDLAKIVKVAQDEEAACAHAGGDFRKHVTTMNTARDMDLIRQVLGEQKISFLGYSYGTFLGAMYGQMFPQQLDRIVLDSAMDPRKSWKQGEAADVELTKANVASWAQWTAARNNTFHLGSTPDQVRAIVDRFAATLQKNPIGEIKSVDVLDGAVGEASRYRAKWADLAKHLGALVPALDGGDVNAEAVAGLNTLARPDAEPTPPPQPGDDQGGDQGQPGQDNDKPAQDNGTMAAILCDWNWPSNPQDYYADMRRVAAEVPFGGSVQRVAPFNCTFTSGRDPMVEIGKRQYQPGIVIQAEGDTQTAYADGVGTADYLDMPLITVLNSGVHGHYNSTHNACVDDAVNAYLIDGKLPDRRTNCQAAQDIVADIPADS